MEITLPCQATKFVAAAAMCQGAGYDGVHKDVVNPPYHTSSLHEQRFLSRPREFSFRVLLSPCWQIRDAHLGGFSF
jgi:hypothetical protein